MQNGRQLKVVLAREPSHQLTEAAIQEVLQEGKANLKSKEGPKRGGGKAFTILPEPVCLEQRIHELG